MTNFSGFMTKKTHRIAKCSQADQLFIALCIALLFTGCPNPNPNESTSPKTLTAPIDESSENKVFDELSDDAKAREETASNRSTDQMNAGHDEGTNTDEPSEEYDEPSGLTTDLLAEFPISVAQLKQDSEAGKYDWRRYVVVLDGGPVLLDCVFDIDGTGLSTARSAAAERAFRTFGFARQPPLATASMETQDPSEESSGGDSPDANTEKTDSLDEEKQSTEVGNSELANPVPNDTKPDGLRWADAVSSVHLQSQLLPNLKPGDDDQIDSLIAQYDTNEDSIVQENEFLNWMTRGITRRNHIRQTEANQFRYANRDDSVVFQRIDADRDGQLDENEISQLPNRIRSLDRNNDFLIGFDEVVSEFSTRNSLNETRLDFDTLIFDVFDEGTDSKMRGRLEDEYSSLMGFTESCFPKRPELFHELNDDEDEELDADEFLGLLERPSEVLIHVSFRDLEITPSQSNCVIRVSTKWDDQSRAPVKFDAATNSLQLWDMNIDLTVSNNLSFASVSDQIESVESQLGISDSTHGKTDQTVLVFGRNGSAECFDLNGDDQIDSEEVHQGVRALARLTAGELRIRFFDPRDAWFRFIDTDRNSLLTEVELTSSVERIRSILSETQQSSEESGLPPTAIPLPQICFIQRMVASSDPFENFSPNDPRTNSQQPVGPSPKWFVAMDLNSDGFVAFREFLGERKKFAEMDLNKDGIIDADEVGARRSAQPHD